MRVVPQEIVAAAQAAQAKWNVPASISIAQWAVESGWGLHMPPGSFNPFGIKAIAGQPSVTVVTREVINGRSEMVTAPFRKFGSIAEAFDEHGHLLAIGSRYAKARLVRRDPYAFANALTGVYATDPNYGAALIGTIRSHNLTQYDAKKPLPVIGTAPIAVAAAPVAAIVATQNHAFIPVFLAIAIGLGVVGLAYLFLKSRTSNVASSDSFNNALAALVNAFKAQQDRAVSDATVALNNQITELQTHFDAAGSAAQVDADDTAAVVAATPVIN